MGGKLELHKHVGGGNAFTLCYHGLTHSHVISCNERWNRPSMRGNIGMRGGGHVITQLVMRRRGVTLAHHDMPEGMRREEGGRGGRRGVTLTHHVNGGRVKESIGLGGRCTRHVMS